MGWPYTVAQPVRGARRDRRHYASWGRQSTKSLVPSGYRHDPSGSLDMAAELGCTSCQTPRCKACDGGFGKAHRYHPSPDVDGWYRILLRPLARQVGLSLHIRTISLTSA